MENISDNITYKEATRSDTAERNNLDNTPDSTQLKNMKMLAMYVFEPLRIWVGGPIKINSFFRAPDVNIAVGGSGTSQHCKGQAFDLDDTFGHKTNAEMFHYIKDNMDFDQMIWEYGDETNPAWVHVSFKSDGNNRRQLLRKEKGKGYELWQ
jgi:hypothetical protein